MAVAHVCCGYPKAGSSGVMLCPAVRKIIQPSANPWP